jgi:ankyrin repeat protein
MGRVASMGQPPLAAWTVSRRFVDMPFRQAARAFAAPPDATPTLHVAAFSNDDKMVQQLLLHGAKIEERDNNGCTPLVIAVNQGNVKTARVLLQLGAHPDAQVAFMNERTPLHFVVERMTGETPESTAIGTEMLELLLSHGASPTDVKDVEEDDALAFSIKLGHSTATKVLLDHTKKLPENNNYLHLATAVNNLATMDLLMQFGVSNKAVDAAGNTALHVAAMINQSDVVPLLFVGVEPKSHDSVLLLGLFNAEGCTALHEAASRGAQATLLSMLQQLPSPLDSDEETKELVSALVNAMDGEGNTCLHSAAHAGDSDANAVRALLSAGAMADVKQGGEGMTPLHLACFSNAPLVVEMLVRDGGADPSAAAALHFAAASGSVQVLKQLLELGADPDTALDGKLALQFALAALEANPEEDLKGRLRACCDMLNQAMVKFSAAASGRAGAGADAESETDKAEEAKRNNATWDEAAKSSWG